MALEAEQAGAVRLAAALDVVIEEAARAIDVTRATPALAKAATAAVRRAAEDALVAALALPAPAGGARVGYAPQPGLAEIYGRAGTATDGGPVAYDLQRNLGNVAAGVQLVIHHAIEAALALHDDPRRPALVRLGRSGGDLVLTVDAPS